MTDARLLLRVIALALAAGFIALLWQALPAIRLALAPVDASPRLVAARGDLASDEASTIELFETTRPSVVFITTAARARDPWTRNAFDVPRGTGSGFVWDDAGHIVTNAHVIAGASSATVRRADGEAAPASLVGFDQRSDIAVLRIAPDRTPLRPIPIGVSGDLRVGQKVFAIGNPFGLDWTLTTGVVSALGRDLPGGAGPALRGLIQTDAAINPGNSGGPLLDSAGRLIGVNTAIYSPSGGSAGIGFAVPVDEVNRIVPQIIASGSYAPPVLGVEVDPQINAIAARQGVGGVIVLGVAAGSPAERAGLRPARIEPAGRIAIGDVIVGLGDEAVENVDDFLAALARHAAGEAVEVAILREGRREVLEATLDPG